MSTYSDVLPMKKVDSLKYGYDVGIHYNKVGREDHDKV